MVESIPRTRKQRQNSSMPSRRDLPAGRFSSLVPVGMTALCLVNQTCKLLPEMSTFNLLAFIAFMFEAFDKIRDTNAPARTGYIKCAFKGCLRIHAAKH